MIERYTKPEMGQIWTEFNEWDTLKQVEILASEAQAELGNIPKEAAKEIREKAAFSVDRIHEIEAETHHDIAAFVSNLSENIGEAGKYVHLGLTSTDVKDTALGSMLKQASDILIKDLEDFHAVLRRRAVEFKYTPCIGRTHGIHAEATTFGLKLCNWMAEIVTRYRPHETRLKKRSLSVKFPELSVRMLTLIPSLNNMSANISALRPRRFRRRPSSVTAMPNTLRPWPSLPAPSIKWRRKFVIFSGRKSGKLKNISAPNRRARPSCLISATPLPVNACAA